ncbi:MAG: hypothetical protein ACREQZ_15605 [Woeseiaceae bacterium]
MALRATVADASTRRSMAAGGAGLSAAQRVDLERSARSRGFLKHSGQRRTTGLVGEELRGAAAGRGAPATGRLDGARQAEEVHRGSVSLVDERAGELIENVVGDAGVPCGDDRLAVLSASPTRGKSTL